MCKQSHCEKFSNFALARFHFASLLMRNYVISLVRIKGKDPQKLQCQSFLR